MQIRSLVDEKRIEEAQEECMEQTNSLMSLIMANEDYKKEYLALWSTKRINPMAIFEDTSTEKAKTPTTKPVKKKSTLHGNLQVLPGQSIPEAVVADALREASDTIHGKTSKKGKSEIQPPPQVQQPVNIEREARPKPATKAPVPPAKTKRAVEHKDFELPAVIAEKTKEPASSVVEKVCGRSESL